MKSLAEHIKETHERLQAEQHIMQHLLRDMPFDVAWVWDEIGEDGTRMWGAHTYHQNTLETNENTARCIDRAIARLRAELERF